MPLLLSIRTLWNGTARRHHAPVDPRTFVEYRLMAATSDPNRVLDHVNL
jgi:hypothetical protein